MRSTRFRRARPGVDENPWGNAFETAVTMLENELAARRDVDPSRSRSWRIVNRSQRNALGEPTAYKLLPGATPTLLADPDLKRGAAGGFASHNLWVTPFDPDERRAAGDYPNQHHGHAGVADLDRRGQAHRGHGHRPVALLRRDAHTAARRLAGDAGRVHGLHVASFRLLRPQSCAGRASVVRPLP